MAVASAALALSGCVTVEKTSFAKQAGQEVLVRSGRDAILSQTGSTQLIVAPASRTEQMPRPTYVALIRNTGKKPVTLRYSDISVVQTDTGKSLKVWTVDELQSEARGQAIALALLGGVAGAASGYYSGSGTINGQHYTYSGYNGAAASAIANANVRSAAAEGGVEGVRDIRRPDDHDLPPGLEAVHEGQELGYDPALNLFFSSHLLPFRGDGVDLVDEYD